MSYSAAIRHLKKSDPVMRRIITRLGKCELSLELEDDRNPFGTLADAIIYQQLAYAAAKTIAGRFREIYATNSSRPRLPRPAELLATPLSRLRKAGLSRQKASYLFDLAQKAESRELCLHGLRKMSDEEVVANLTQVKGIGRWTAEMFLIFSLGRLDVLPVGDLGVQYGFKDAYGMRKLPKPERMERIAEPWRPFRTVGTWYLWRLRREALGIKPNR